MLLGHGAVAEQPIASLRGTGVQNVGSAFISGLSFAASVGDETVTAGANVETTTAGQITVSLGEETPFGEAFQNLITLSTGSPNFFIWNEVDDSQTVTWTDVEPGSTD